MFDRPSTGQNVLLVHVTDSGMDNPEAELAEFTELATSAGLTVLDRMKCRRDSPDPRLFLGTGKIAEVAAMVTMIEAELVLFNRVLSPSQERNLEAELKVRVFDRNALILDIFAQRARTFEGKLQVELAQLVHLSTRLVRGWTHLERQKGGIGLRGPGEKQLETDRRLLGARVKTIRRRLEKVRKQREQGRAMRGKSGVPTVALVGYTNAGKSTLFNRLSSEEVYAADQLFATLDPTLRKLKLGGGRHCILVDTVGFISNLPHELVDSFRSTLVETREADLLLHVVDCSDEERQARMSQVNEVLSEIGAHEVPQLLVFNKADRIGTECRIDCDEHGQPEIAWISALGGDGCENLPAIISQALGEHRVVGWLHLQATEGKLRAMAYAADSVTSETAQQDGSCILGIDVDRDLFEQWCKQHTGLQSRFSDDGSGPSDDLAVVAAND